MFVVTALGHQGWLLGTARTHVLIDPILEAGFARLPLSAPTVFPPRRIDLAAFPPIDAVLISHEHPDHLDFASLQRVDRGVPIYLSAHASDAARRVIASLGFRVEALTPGVPCGIGELGVLPLPPYVIGEPGENEVDVVPLLVRDHEGHGNFFTSVDIHQTREMAAEVRRHVDRPGVWTYANNAMDSSHHYEWMARPTDPVAEQARSVHENYVGLFQGWEQPEVFLINGNGVRLGRDLEPLNRHLFHLDGEALAAEMESRLPGHAFRAVRPGTTVTMVDGEVVEVREGQPFLGTAERDEWPARGGEPVADGARLDFEPGTGREALTDAERDELERALAEFGRFLFARASYRGIYKLMAGRDHPPAMLPTLALALREGPEGRAQVWEFRPRACAFVRVACESPRDRYVAGGEFWASDVLASLTCRALADDLFHLGRKRLWNAAPKVFRCDLDTELQLYSHALRLPGPVEALYRGCLAPESRVALRAPTEAERAPPHDHTQPPPRRATKRRPTPADDHALAPAEALADGTVAALGEAVARASGGAWALDAALLKGAVLSATLALPGAAIGLQVARRDDARRYYRVVGALSFAYGPGAVSGPQLAVLDRVIDAVAVALAASPLALGSERAEQVG